MRAAPHRDERGKRLRKPATRPTLPTRRSDNDKRRLHPSPDGVALGQLASRAVYNGISKHKAEPLKFGLLPYTGRRGDESLCDQHAVFDLGDWRTISELLTEGIRAGLIGKVEAQGVPTMLWTVSDQGWIFEARVTNVGLADYHGYPVRASESIAEQVYSRFRDWVGTQAGDADRRAVVNCRALYGFSDD
ncbi:MAG TPA: hypothetical protein VND19_24935 [Acetobacteraceae bacterium]|nr:hypothetical protein [Acetobacteraceae bacterium]